MRATTSAVAALAMLIACTPPTGVGQFTNEVEEQLPPPNLLAAIDGPSCVDRPGTYTFSAVVQPYDPTYTFAWVSVDGVGEHALGNDQRVQVRIDKDSDIVQLALRVAGPRGASATAEKTVRMRQEDDQDELPELNLAPLPCD